MVRMIIAGALLSCGAAFAGWKARDVRDAQSCDYLAGEISLFEGYIIRLPPIKNDIPPSVVAGIYQCWAANPEKTLMRQIRLADARQLTKSTYLLAFGIWGVADRSILFEVDASGRVGRAYNYPYTL